MNVVGRLELNVSLGQAKAEIQAEKPSNIGIHHQAQQFDLDLGPTPIAELIPPHAC